MVLFYFIFVSESELAENVVVVVGDFSHKREGEKKKARKMFIFSR